MTSTFVNDVLAPDYIGEDRLLLEVDDASLPLLALQPVIINIDYSQVGRAGVMLPIEMEVQPPTEDGTGYVRQKFTKVVPSSVVFTPINAGQHLVLVKETNHNLWQGRLLIEVEGDDASKVETLERT